MIRVVPSFNQSLECRAIDQLLQESTAMALSLRLALFVLCQELFYVEEVARFRVVWHALISLALDLKV